MSPSQTPTDKPLPSSDSQSAIQPESSLWTIDDVARYARCSVRHVTTLREQKGLPFRKLGHLVRFSPEAVKRWFED
jgi:excisionase family DNA binding protein